MKTNLLALMALTLALFSAPGMQAQKLIHYWHFNNTLPTTGAGGTHLGTGPIYSDFTRYNSHSYIRYTKVPQCIKDTGYIDNNAGDSTNQRVGYGACCPVFGATTNNSSVRTRNPSDSMEFLWYIPTKNFKNIILKWASEASSTSSGQHRQNYDYSLDSGITYITAGLPRLYDSAGTGWGKITLNLSSITTINNSSKLIFRIRLGTPNTGTSGNNRFDNITVEGDSIASTPTGIHSNTAEAFGYSLYPNPTSNQVSISAPSAATRNISIVNVVGQAVLSTTREEKDFLLDVSSFPVGLYFVQISDLNGDNKTTLKLVKQ